MAYQEEKQVKLRRQVTKQAITAAIQGNWQESISLNKQIIESFPNDSEAYNRLGKAYMELGDYSNAKDAYNHAVQLDQYNLIAVKNMQRLARLGEGKAETRVTTEKAEPQIFLEETGKAAVVNLYQLATPEVLLKMVAGDKVHLEIRNSSLVIENSAGQLLGLVPAKYSQRLKKLIKGGNKYTAAVVSTADNAISVIIREVFQDPSQVGHASFPSRRIEELPTYLGEQILRHELEEEEEAGAEEFREEEETPEVPGDFEEKARTWEQEV